MRLVSRRLGVAEVVSVMVVLAISIALAGTAYMWGMPLITKRQDTSKVERIYQYYNEYNPNSLVAKISKVARNGGKETFKSDTDGVWTLRPWNETGSENNTLDYSVPSKVTNVIELERPDLLWMSFTEGSACPPEKGIVGTDSPIVVCARSEPLGEGYNVTYRAWIRELDDVISSRGYRVNLVVPPNGRKISTGDTVSISRERVYTSGNVIITEVKIYLT